MPDYDGPELASSATKPSVERVEHLNNGGAAAGADQHASATRRRDKAAELVNSAREHVVLTAAENRRVLRKIDLAILPILLSVYFLQQLDKSTLAYASVFGLIEDTGLQGQDLSWLGSIVYIAQLVMQPLVAYFLVKLPIGKFTFVVVLCWGTVLCGMAAAHNFAGLMVTRFFLGSFEAAIGKFGIDFEATRIMSSNVS